jgi:hypothetical protein
MALGSSGSGKTVFAKVVVEEAAARGIPVIAVDPQGDLCGLAVPGDEAALAERGLAAQARELADRTDVVVFTPASRRGVPLCVDPVSLPPGLDGPERLAAVTRAATAIVGLVGWEPAGDDGQGLVAVFDRCLNEMLAAGTSPEALSLEGLETHLAASEPDGWPAYVRYLDPKKIRAAAQRLARLDVGARRLLFHEGIPLDVDVLLGRDPRAAPPDGRVRVAVIYLNTLHSQEDKEFFLAALVDRLYAWMLAHPSPDPQALFYVDEIAPFIPPVRKPACKDGLSLLFKQARKYGLGCLMATQNPGDVDYKAMAQFGTWALGRLTTLQDRRKIEPVVKSLAPDGADAILETLPRLKPGELVLLSPDVFDAPAPLSTRWLLTRHETFDEDRIAALARERWDDRFAALAAADDGGEGEPDTVFVSLPEARESSPIPVVEPAKGMRADDTVPDLRIPAPSTGDVALGVALRGDDTMPEVPVDVFATDPSEPGEPVDPELRAHERVLASEESMSVKEMAAAASVGERKARAVLKALVAADLAGFYKEGRSHRYWAKSTGGRPDLGMPLTVWAAQARVGRSDAERLVRNKLRGKVLGLLGDEERLHELELSHRLVYKLDFEEKVLKPLLSRLLGETHDDRVGSVYLHAHTLDVLVLTHKDGIRFEARPAGRASEVADLDGAARFEQVAPARLHLDEHEWRGRRSKQKVVQRFREQWDATPRAVTPFFVPVWRALLEKGGGAAYRVISIDGIVGMPVDWPAT